MTEKRVVTKDGEDKTTKELLIAEQEAGFADPVVVGHELTGIIPACVAADKQIWQLIEWVKHVPGFMKLPLVEQVLLLKTGWNELMLIALAQRSLDMDNNLLLMTGETINAKTEALFAVGLNERQFTSILTEVVKRLKDMAIDKVELAFLKGITLCNPLAALYSEPDPSLQKGSKELPPTCLPEVKVLQDKLYSSLQDYVEVVYKKDPNRYQKVILRLPTIRSIAITLQRRLFIYFDDEKIPFDQFLETRLHNNTP